MPPSAKSLRHVKRLVTRRHAFVESLEGRRLFAFGVTTGTTPTGQSTYVIDNGSDLKFAVIRGGTLSSTIHLGDVSSIQYKSKELLATYAVTSRYSHYEQGLSNATAISYTVDANAGWILVKCDDSSIASGGVIQYYAVRENDNNLYMASLPTDVNNGPGEGRFIAYLDRNVFSSPEAPSDNRGSTGSIEGSDVFGRADGTTTSKFYNMGRRMIENDVHGLVGNAGGTAVGAYMYMGNRERSAGGPFFKDIDFQASNAVEIYNCIFTGHTQTEPYRQGLHTYAMGFNNGTAPAPLDLSWLETIKDASNNLLIGGLIPASQRGAIAGKATGNPAGHETVVTLSNADAQYWDMADASGNYAIPGVLPGTYTLTIYDNELAVGTRTVTVAAGKSTTANVVNAFYTPANPIFRIGQFDGTPLGFLNADKIEIMHPSDVRMSSWTATPNFVVGTNTAAQWPMAQFMGVNNSQRITFNLTNAQTQNLTLRIGITLGFAGARPRITVNGGQSYAWTSAIPSASDNLNSRGVTRGTWRGNNQLYSFAIPASAFRAGTNTIDLPMVSGSYTAGSTWLSPNVVFDAIDLVPTTTATPPAIASVTLAPANATVPTNGTRAYTAVARDAGGNVLAANFDFTASGGTIDPSGNYVAPATPGTYTIAATAITTRTRGYNSSSSSTSAIGASLTGNGSTAVNVVAPAPVLTSFAVNDGAAQRSMVKSLTLTFDKPVALAGNAITLTQQGGSAIGYTLSPTTGPSSQYVLTFSGGSFVGGSLADGIYTLTVNGAGITAAGSAQMAGALAYTFHRLFGDFNGDKTVDSVDSLAFRRALGTSVGTAGYVDYFDADGDGIIDSIDSLRQRRNLGVTYVY